jgi:hypothetical protein
MCAFSVIIVSMLKILSGTAIVVLTLVLIVFGAGLNRGPEIETQLDVYLDFSQDYIFNQITDILAYSDRKRDLENLEILERDGNQILRWRENYKMGKWREYELVELYPDVYFEYKITDSSYSHSATVSYYLTQGDQFTKIEMKESGRIDSTWQRGLRFISSDKSYLKQEAKWLRVSIQQELLNRQ